MHENNFRTLLAKTAGFLSVASLSVLISLPGLSQQSPDGTNPNVPSTTKPTNPGGRDAGTTNGGEDLNRVPTTGNQVPAVGKETPGSTTGGDSRQQVERNQSVDPTSKPDAINRVEGRDQGSPQDRMNSAPSGSTVTPGANQPGATTGGDSSQQVERSNGSMQQRNSGSTQQRTQTTTTPQSGNQSSPQQEPTPSDVNSGSSLDSQQNVTQQEPSGSSVRALW